MGFRNEMMLQKEKKKKHEKRTEEKKLKILKRNVLHFPNRNFKQENENFSHYPRLSLLENEERKIKF